MDEGKLNRTRSYVDSIDLSGIPRQIVMQSENGEPSEVFDQAKSQAQVVGSGLFSFSQGVDTQVREAISNSALLAQLVANKRVVQAESPLEWFKQYSDVLQNVGWVQQESGWSDYTSKGNAVEVDKKIIEVMTAVLGAAPAALSIITATISALGAMDASSSWMKIFTRESQKATIGRFQVGLVERAEGDDVSVSMLACLVEARTAISQLLFFKFHNAQATFKANNAKVSIDRASLVDLGPSIVKKVRAYQVDYLSTICDI
jgi:hypothetical protein